MTLVRACDRAFPGFVAPAPLLGLPDMVATTVLRRIAPYVRCLRGLIPLVRNALSHRTLRS